MYGIFLAKVEVRFKTNKLCLNWKRLDWIKFLLNDIAKSANFVDALKEKTFAHSLTLLSFTMELHIKNELFHHIKGIFCSVFKEEKLMMYYPYPFM